MRCVVSVLGKDRSGIVAGVSRVLAEKGANIDDISQTILDEIFSMTMLGHARSGCGRFQCCADRARWSR